MILSVRTLAEAINNNTRIVYYEAWYDKTNVYYYDKDGPEMVYKNSL